MNTRLIALLTILPFLAIACDDDDDSTSPQQQQQQQQQEQTVIVNQTQPKDLTPQQNAYLLTVILVDGSYSQAGETDVYIDRELRGTVTTTRALHLTLPAGEHQLHIRGQWSHGELFYPTQLFSVQEFDMQEDWVITITLS